MQTCIKVLVVETDPRDVCLVNAVLGVNLDKTPLVSTFDLLYQLSVNYDHLVFSFEVCLYFKRLTKRKTEI